MAEQIGTYFTGVGVVINPGTGGDIVDASSNTEIVTGDNADEVIPGGGGVDPSQPQILKTHSGYTDSEWTSYTFAVTTTSTLTTAIANLGPPENSSMSIRAFITGKRADNAATAMFVVYGSCFNNGGTTSEIITYPVVDCRSSLASDVTATITSADVDDSLNVNVSGQTGETWYWVAKVEWIVVFTDV